MTYGRIIKEECPPRKSHRAVYSSNRRNHLFKHVTNIYTRFIDYVTQANPLRIITHHHIIKEMGAPPYRRYGRIFHRPYTLKIPPTPCNTRQITTDNIDISLRCVIREQEYRTNSPPSVPYTRGRGQYFIEKSLIHVLPQYEVRVTSRIRLACV